VDKHSHHKIKKGNFQVSKRVNSICRQKGKKKEKGGAIKKEVVEGVMNTYLQCAFVLIKVVFRL
jgi:hypothetical protein